jgi:hypothetical protein
MRFLSFLALLALAAPLPAQVQPASPPPAVPAMIDPPAGSHLLLQAQGVGSQVYLCAVHGLTAAWQFKAPDAKLLDASGKQIGIHFAGPSWRLTDGSEVQGSVIGSKPASGSIPWLLLNASVHNGSGQLSKVDFIRRTDTQGGVMPTSGCDAHHAGAQAHIPYSATYSFYSK